MKRLLQYFESWVIVIGSILLLLFFIALCITWSFHCWRLLHPSAPSWLYLFT